MLLHLSAGDWRNRSWSFADHLLYSCDCQYRLMAHFSLSNRVGLRFWSGNDRMYRSSSYRRLVLPSILLEEGDQPRIQEAAPKRTLLEYDLGPGHGCMGYCWRPHLFNRSN